MKKIFWIALFFISACKENNTEQGKQSTDANVVTATSQKLQLNYPKSWTLTYNPDSISAASIVSFQSPLENGEDAFQENMQVYHEVMPMRIDDSSFHLSSMLEIKLRNNNLQVNNLGKHKYGENEFNEWQFSFIKDSKEYAVHGFTRMCDSVGYHFSFTAEKQNEKKYQHEVEQMLSSFKPL